MRQTERPSRKVPVIFAVIALTLGPFQLAQAATNLWLGANLANYSTDANWSVGFVPANDEIATINNNTTAVLSAAAPNASGLLLGQTATDVGGLRINSGGSLTTVTDFG